MTKEEVLSYLSERYPNLEADLVEAATIIQQLRADSDRDKAKRLAENYAERFKTRRFWEEL